MCSVCGEKPEKFVEGMPEPKGCQVRVTAFVDSALMACKATGKESTGIAILVNQTPSEWHAKLQKTVETATHGA